VDVQIIKLFQKYINEACNEQELEEVFAILKQGLYFSEWQHVIAEEAEQALLSGVQTELSQIEIDAIYAGIGDRLPSAARKSIPLWPKILGIAAAVVGIVIGVYFFQTRKLPADPDSSLTMAGVSPGKVGATLTLAGGQKIKLSEAGNGTIAEESGLRISKTEDGQLLYEVQEKKGNKNKFNTLSTAKGETYKVRLPDGSMVYLNAASSLTYGTVLNEQGRRVVKLSGEGYFEVKKDKAHPFIVKTANQEVEVLGTHFNVNAYSDEQMVKTALLEGSVKVSGAGETKILVPGQQANLLNGKISLTKADLEEVVSWKNGEIILNGQDVQTVMRMISRWYDVEIVYEGVIPTELYYAKISRFDNIGKLLKLLEKAQGIHFKIEGRKVIVTK
jgi:transmembrane sensor